MVALGLVVAEYHGPIIEEMEAEARSAAEGADADVLDTIYVPGAYDTPLAADRLARRDDIDAVAVLGAIISGDTDHDQVIGNAAAQGLTRVSLDHETPVTFGISGPGMTAAEAHERVDKGADAVTSAIQLAEEL